MIPKGTPSKHLRMHLDLSDGKTPIQIDCICKDWIWHVLDVPVACNTDYYLVGERERERLSVGKLATNVLIWKD